MPKKKRKRGAQDGGIDPNERRRQRLEARRQERAAAIAAARRQALRERIIRWVTIAGVVAVIVWFLFLRGRGPSEIEGHEVKSFSIAGSGDHVQGTVNYETTPPVSGAHAAQSAPCGVHSAPIPNENLVHTLEHGAIGILYLPELEPDSIAEIESLVRDYESHVFSAPYPGMEPQIAVAAWSKRMDLDALDASAIREFIDAFRKKGPEENPCPPSQDSPFGQPTPSPSPEPSPS
jgi:hypothetical protein